MLNMKKGEKAVLLGFTGIRLSEVEISAATKTTVTVTKKDGTEMVFDRKTGVQTNAANQKYANKLVSLEDAPAPKAKKEDKKAPKKEDKKSGKKAKVEEDEEDEDEDEEPTPKKSSKKEDKKSSKKSSKKVEPEEDEDDEDDEDFEEV